MTFRPTRLMIFGKTYPELSKKYVETVCTGAITEAGKPVRLYPVPLRYLEGEQQYGLYNWITVPIEKSTTDPRPESYRIRPDQIQLHDVVKPDSDEWSARRDMVFRDTSWHFGGMADLKAANEARECSIGFVQPGSIENITMAEKSAQARKEFDEKLATLQAQVESDMFHPSFKSLEFASHEITLHWRCASHCATCKKKPHAMKVLDWGLFELARKHSWEGALHRLREISDLRRYDFRLYLGNFRLHPRNFGIIGLWYPKLQAQQSFFRQES